MVSALQENLLRAVIGFLVLIILVRVIGNKQLGQLNVFTYISGTVIGSMVGEIILHRDLNLWNSISGLVVWTILTIGIEIVSLKSIKARELLDGQPVILIKKGRIMYHALKKERMNIDDLTMLLRTNMVFSILDVDYAILEPNGDLSVLKKQEKENLTKEDMNIQHENGAHIPTTIILEGKVVTKNLMELNLTSEWLDRTLEKLGICNKKDVLYAELQGDGRLYTQLEDGISKIG